MARAHQQAWLFGARYVLGREVTALSRRRGERIVSLSDGREVTARSVLVATWPAIASWMCSSSRASGDRSPASRPRAGMCW
jgi:hypothetical protein